MSFEDSLPVFSLQYNLTIDIDSVTPPCLSVSSDADTGPVPSQPERQEIPVWQSGALSLVQIHRDTAVSLFKIMVLLRQLSYAIKTQLKAPY